jgi:hypothetical protein
VVIHFGVKGNYALNLTYERKIGEGSGVAEIPQVQAVGVEREKGYFGLAAATNVELAIDKIDHASLVDVNELPSSIWGSSASPVLLAFKYLSHPFSVSVDVTKHEELPVLVAAIDSVNGVTLLTDEGKSLTKVVYQVRNNVKQFVRLDLPKQAVLWSVFVSGRPVKPAKDKNDSIMIPLEKSQLSGENLTQFPVEIVYLDVLAKMGFVGSERLQLPKADIPISELSWVVYLPKQYEYFRFRGDVKPTSYHAGRMGGMERAARDKGSYVLAGKKEVGDLLTQTEESQSYAQPSEVQISGGTMRGVLPIRVTIPERGRIFCFTKLLITEKENPWLSFNYIKVVRYVRLVFFVGVLILGFIFFKNLRKGRQIS